MWRQGYWKCEVVGSSGKVLKFLEYGEILVMVMCRSSDNGIVHIYE